MIKITFSVVLNGDLVVMDPCEWKDSMMMGPPHENIGLTILFEGPAEKILFSFHNMKATFIFER